MEHKYQPWGCGYTDNMERYTCNSIVHDFDSCDVTLEKKLD